MPLILIINANSIPNGVFKGVCVWKNAFVDSDKGVAHVAPLHKNHSDASYKKQHKCKKV